MSLKDWLMGLLPRRQEPEREREVAVEQQQQQSDNVSFTRRDEHERELAVLDGAKLRTLRLLDALRAEGENLRLSRRQEVHDPGVD